MKHINLKSLILFALIFAFTGANAQESFSLFHKFQKGEVNRYKAKTTYTSKQEMAGQQINVSGTTSAVSRQEVENALSDGGAEIIYSLEEMIITLKTMGVDTTINQKDIIGKKNRLAINKYGEEIRTQALDSINIQGFNIGVDFGASSQQTFIIFPHKAITTGEKWEYNSTDTNKTAEVEMITKAKYEYTLLGKETKNGHNCMKINIKTTIELGGKMNTMGMQMFIEGTGDVVGTLWFDAAAGKMISDESSTSMDLTMAMTGQMKMTIPSTITVKSIRDIIE